MSEKDRLLGTITKQINVPKMLNWRLYLIGVVLTLYYFSQGMMTYIVSEWIQYYVKTNVFVNISDSNAQQGCEDVNHTDPAYKLYAEVQKESARWQMYNIVCRCIPVLFVIPFWPSYSDHVGRKFLFILALSSACVRCVIVAFLIHFKLKLVWIVIVLTIDGFSGAHFTVVSGASAFMGDITRKVGSKRALGFTLLESVMMINITLSGVTIGFVIKYAGFFIPTLCCAFGMFLAVLLVVFGLPESLESHNRSTQTNALGYLRRTFTFFRSDVFRGKRTAYILLILAYAMQMMGSANRTNIETIYQLGMPFCWTSEQIGIFAALRPAAQGVFGPVCLLLLKRCLSELQIAIFSSFANSVSFLLEGLAFNNLMMYLVAVPATFSYLTVPMLKSIMSSMTSVDKQGSLFAGVMYVECLCMITTNVVSNTMYAATVSFMPGFTFLVLASTSSIVIIILLIFKFTQTIRSDKPVEKSINQPT